MGDENKVVFGIQMCRENKRSTVVDGSTCIFCQKRRREKTTTTEEGRKQILAAAEIRQDDVLRRINLLGRGAEFIYHCSNACYKSYTHKKTLMRRKRKNEAKQNEESITLKDQSETTASTPCKKLRRSVTSCKKAASCVICGKLKHNKNVEKYRMRDCKRAEIFLAATSFFKDNVYIRTSCLEDESAVLGVGTYYHKECLEAYIQRYKKECLKCGVDSNTQQRQTKSQRVKDIKPLIKDVLDRGFGITLSEIRDYVNNQAEENPLTNHEVKLSMIELFGDNIQFSSPSQKNQSLLVYSSKLAVDQVADKLRSADFIKEAGTLIRQSLLDLDFSLEDEFGDANQLRKSWEKTPIPHLLVDFLSHVFNIDKLSVFSHAKDDVEPCMTSDSGEQDDAELDCDENEEVDDGKTKANMSCRMKVISQILYYNVHKGRKKTPLHLMTGHSIHEKCKSKQLISSFNRAGLSVSYDQVMKSRRNLAEYTKKACSVDLALPSHFIKSNFTVGAMDNFDHEEASLSGLKGTHDTVMVVFQEVPAVIPTKPKLSAVICDKLEKRSATLLPCQQLRDFCKPSGSVNLPPHFKIADEANILPSDAIEREESVISMLQAVGGLTDQTTFTWSGIHAIISKTNVPLQQVGFLPVLPYPVTAYDSVYSCMKNFQSLLLKLDQQALPVACDEGVFHIAAEIQLVTNEFPDLVLLMGSFHMTKILLACIGKYINGSGLENVLIENHVFGPKVTESVLKGSNYVRSVKGMLMLAEVVERLKWKAFLNLEDDAELTAQIGDLLRTMRYSKTEDTQLKLQQLITMSQATLKSLDDFTQQQLLKSEQCKYLEGFLYLVALLKNLIRSDREGNWSLYLQTVKNILPIFHIFDRVNYVRWCSLFFEKMLTLETDHPEVYEHFKNGHFVVRRTNSKFNAVGIDMALEQTINRSQKSAGGIIGQTSRKEFIAEWELAYHEVLLIRKTFQDLLNIKAVDYELLIHHELTGSLRKRMEEKIQQIFEYVESRENPYLGGSEVRLHHILTNECIPAANAKKMLQFLTTAQELFILFREERFIARSKSLSAPIHLQKMPTFLSIPPPDTLKKKTVKNVINDHLEVDRKINIAKERGMTIDDILTFDVSPSPLLDDNGATTKPLKSQLMSELTKNINVVERNFKKEDAQETVVVVDVMNQFRKLPLKTAETFEDMFTMLDNIVNNVCKFDRVDYVMDSYMQYSIKNAERGRRSPVEPLPLTSITSSTKLPVQMERFWASASNKSLIQKALCDFLKTVSTGRQWETMISGLLLESGPTPALSINGKSVTKIDRILQVNAEEADIRIIPHVFHAIKQGLRRAVVLSNDTDVFVPLINFYKTFNENGLTELWMRKSATDIIPIHILVDRIGPTANVLLAIHFLTGSDVTSKIGTKSAALKITEPQKYLQTFGQETPPHSASMKLAEEYLVKVLKPGSKCKSFNALRLEVMNNATLPNVQDLPCTTASLQGHLKRAFYMVQLYSTILDKLDPLKPTDFGWTLKEKGFMPDPCTRTLPDDLILTCSCKTCKTKRCRCRKNKISCTTFCKCNSCENQDHKFE